MTRYQSGRNKDIKVGIPSYTEDKTVVDVIGRVGIGTTVATRDLDINGDIKIRGGIYDKNDDYGSLNYVIAASGNGEWNWLPIASLSGDIPGITVRYNNSIVGSGGSIKTLNFVARNTNLDVSGSSGIATITSLNTPWFDSIQVTGIATFNQGKVLVGGTNPSLTDQIFQVFGSSYISGFVGIGITNPTSTLQVSGNVTIVNPNAAGLNVRSGAAGSYTSFNVGRTNADGTIAVVASSGQFANDSVTGDVVIRTESSTAKLLFTNSATNSTLSISGNNVLVGSVSSTGTTNQRLQVTGGAYISTSVGIGTTNPLEILHILSSAGRGRFENNSNNYSVLIDPAINGPRVSLGVSGTSAFMEFGAYNNTNNLDTKTRDLRILSTAATNAFTLKQDTGFVGIGTTNPLARLSIGAGSINDSFIPVQVSTPSSNSLVYFGANNNGSYGALFGYDRANYGGGVVRVVGATDNLDFIVNNTSFAARITPSRNIGIGTTNPQATLQIKDALAFETTNTTTSSTSQIAIDSFGITTFRSAKYHVQITCPGQISTLGGITTGGRGYTAGTFNVTFTTSSGTGADAQGTLTVSNGTVGALSIISGGSGYNTGDVLTASGGSGLQVSVASTSSPTGEILTLGSITSAGIGYTASVGVGTTTIAFLGGTGTSATGLATIFDGVITSSTLLQQPTTGTGGTVFYSGSNYTTSSVLSVDRTTLTNTIIGINTSVGVSTFTSLTAHGLFVNDIIRSSSTSNGLTANTVDYYVVTTPTTTTFTLGTSVGIGTTFTAGTSLAIGFYRNSAIAGGLVTFTNAITGVSTNFQVSDLLVLQNGSTVDYVEYAGIANNDILGNFAADISGSNARLLLTPTYRTNTVKVARQVMTI